MDPIPGRRLTRARCGGRIAGVCKGLADYMGVRVIFVRIAAVILAIYSAGIFVLLYVLAAWLMPTDGDPPKAGCSTGLEYQSAAYGRPQPSRARAPETDPARLIAPRG